MMPRIVQDSAGLSVPAAMNTPMPTRETTMTSTFSMLRPGSISGDPLIFPDSFRYATIEPVRVTAPMKIPR